MATMRSLAQGQGLPFYELPGPEGSIAAMLAVDLRRYEPLLLTEKPASSTEPTKGIRPRSAIGRDRMVVVVGSSFVSQVRAMTPIGLLHHRGETLQSIDQHGYTRILGIVNTQDAAPNQPTTNAPQQFVVRHRSDWQPELFRSALQAGPGIIEQGALDISERDLQRAKYFRSFVAECGNTAVVGASLVPVHLYTLGQSLVAFFAAHNLACNEVVNLAGDRESVLLLRSDTQAAYLGDPQPHKVGLIGFRQRLTTAVANDSPGN